MNSNPAGRFGLGALLLCVLSSCEEREAKPRAEFGVLYGGDIQDRAQIPLKLPPERQAIGLRVHFPRPLQRDALISWEFERPTRLPGRDSGVLYAAELGEQRVPAGETRFDAPLRFRKDDPLGTWRIRIRVDGRVILERDFEVIAPGS